MKSIKEYKKPINIINDINIFIKEDYYTDSFGDQWNKFSQTQIDNNFNSHSYERFFNETGLSKKDFLNKNILEIGSGAGRFTNIMLDHTEGNIYSVDSSNSVFANYKNNKKYINDRLYLYKSSIYDLPFEKNQFDIVICFGVLQHTPDIKKSIKCLCDQVKKNGLLIVDFYPYNGFWTFFNAKYILRPITKRMSVQSLEKFFKNKINFFIKIYFFLEKIKLGFLNRFLPIPDITKTIPVNINKKLLSEMVLLDTIDMLSPKFDKPQKIKKIRNLIFNHNFSIIFAGKIKYDSYISTVIRGKKN